MGLPIVTIAGIITCPHGGKAVPAAIGPRVRAGGAPVLLTQPPLPVAGCPLGGATVGGGETGNRYVFKVGLPCQLLVFPEGTRRVLSQGRPLLLLGKPGTAVPAGLPITPATSGQTRVLAV